MPTTSTVLRTIPAPWIFQGLGGTPDEDRAAVHARLNAALASESQAWNALRRSFPAQVASFGATMKSTTAKKNDALAAVQLMGKAPTLVNINAAGAAVTFYEREVASLAQRVNAMVAEKEAKEKAGQAAKDQAAALKNECLELSNTLTKKIPDMNAYLTTLKKYVSEDDMTKSMDSATQDIALLTRLRDGLKHALEDVDKEAVPPNNGATNGSAGNTEKELETYQGYHIWQAALTSKQEPAIFIKDLANDMTVQVMPPGSGVVQAKEWIDARVKSSGGTTTPAEPTKSNAMPLLLIGGGLLAAFALKK
jgi:hypothetical protein